MKQLVNPDLLAGVGAMLFAALGVTVAPQLSELVDPTIAGGFAVAAFGRWYAGFRKAKKELSTGSDA